VRPEAKLLVGGEDDELVLSRKSGLGVEAQQCVQHGKRAFRYAEPWPRCADRAKDLPLVDHFVRRPGRSGHLCRHMGKR